MYREIEHKADISYEIEAQNFEEFLKDVVEILLENSTIFSTNSERFEAIEEINKDEKNRNDFINSDLESLLEKCYNINNENQNYEDFVFDLVNDIISMIDRSFYPKKVKGFCVYFSKAHISCKIKALTYHRFFVKYEGNKLHARMVFDV
ncbi:MAG: archease [Fervidobacterium sp.]